MSLRIVYFGTPEFAVPTLDALLRSHHVVCGVVTQPDRPRGRGRRVTPGPVKSRAVAHGLTVFQPSTLRTPEAHAAIAAWQPDLGVVAAYGKLIPDDLLAVPRLGMINVHASLLPKYRGAAPIHRAILAGDPDTGVTIMRVAHDLDAGPVFATARIPIADQDTSADVERALAVAGAALLLDVVNAIEQGTAREVPQDEARATYAPRLTKDEGRVDWSASAQVIHDRIRGLHPWPLACTHLAGERLILLRSRVLPASDVAIAPGTIVDAQADGLVVAAGDNTRLALLEVQPEGRRAMPIRDFLAGRTTVRPGAAFDVS
ncbi:MAG: methionyl-tRNA formyltransferase [Vicinamibacterales bacterium]